MFASSMRRSICALTGSGSLFQTARGAAAAGRSPRPGSREIDAANTRQGSWYVAHCLEVDVTSQGETLETALANVREASGLSFEESPPVELPPPPIIASMDVAIAHS